MENEDFSGSQLSSVWESWSSSDECGSGVFPELCSPDNNCPWLLHPNLSKAVTTLEDGFVDHQEIFLSLDDTRPLPPPPSTSFKLQECQNQKSLDLSNPDSPCSPLFFSLPHDHHHVVFGAVPFLQQQQQPVASYGALHMQIQDHSKLAASKNERKITSSTISIAGGNAAAEDHGAVEIGSKRARIKDEAEREEDDEDCPSTDKRRCLSEVRNSAAEESAEGKSAAASMSSSEISALALGPALNTDGKPRAKRGSATDPQSVYARQRRERINERLRALQGLVPNGAKVDIVTMLEEAINYVKFLQLQVKLLSSDEHWMYAPTTYNGMNISFGMHLGMQSYLKIKD